MPCCLLRIWMFFSRHFLIFFTPPLFNFPWKGFLAEVSLYCLRPMTIIHSLLIRQTNLKKNHALLQQYYQFYGLINMSTFFVHTNEPTSVNWKRESDACTTDEVIQAYLEGVQDGQNAHFKVLINQFRNNLKVAQQVSEQLLQEAAKKDICLSEIHLKADSILNFEALFMSSEKDFVSDKFREIYLCARELKNKVQNDRFYISFSFMPFSKYVNPKRLSADGFFCKYVDKK